MVGGRQDHRLADPFVMAGSGPGLQKRSQITAKKTFTILIYKVFFNHLKYIYLLKKYEKIFREAGFGTVPDPF